MTSYLPYALYVGGAFHLGFAAFHLLFWRAFRWRDELPKLTPLNRQVVQVMNLALVTAFVAVAYLSLGYADAMATTPLGHAVCFAVAAFWLGRLIMQFMFFDMRRPASWALAAACAILVALFAAPVFIKPNGGI